MSGGITANTTLVLTVANATLQAFTATGISTTQLSSNVATLSSHVNKITTNVKKWQSKAAVAVREAAAATVAYAVANSGSVAGVEQVQLAASGLVRRTRKREKWRRATVCVRPQRVGAVCDTGAILKVGVNCSLPVLHFRCRPSVEHGRRAVKLRSHDGKSSPRGQQAAVAGDSWTPLSERSRANLDTHTLDTERNSLCKHGRFTVA